MKVIATIQADLEVTPLGTRSRLADELNGVPFLRRTVERVCAVPGLSGIYVLTPDNQAARCRTLLAGTVAVVQPMNADPPPWAALIRASRKWSLDGWRGGVGGSTVFDEYTDCRLIDGVLSHAEIEADAVLSVPPAAPLFDADLAARMIEHCRANRDEARLTFTQAVPGMAGIILDAAIIKEFAAASIPVGWAFSYKPDTPAKDLIFQPACMEIPAPLRFATGRLIADTDHSERALRMLLQQNESPDLAAIGQWLVDRDETGVEPFPREVELELTTDDPFPNALLRPRGERVGRRGPMSLDLLRRVAAELSEYDDTLCVLGGFGDPLRHPEFSAVLEILRPPSGGGVFGLCVRTAAIDLTPPLAEAIVSHGVDVLSVVLDAWTPELYAKLQGNESSDADGLESVRGRIDRLSELQRERSSPRPIIVPEMVKARENVHELDAFFDGWTRRVGAVNVVGYSHYAGQMEDRGVIDMRPPVRSACKRVRGRCLLFADGRVALCDQDFRGAHPVGRIEESALSEIWRSTEIERVRAGHLAGRYDLSPLCAACAEWHRP
jgi:hypothetical protein